MEDYIYYEVYIGECGIIVANIVGKRIGSLNRGKIFLATKTNHDAFICSGYSGQVGRSHVKTFFEKIIPVKINMVYTNVVFFNNDEDRAVFKEILENL